MTELNAITDRESAWYTPTSRLMGGVDQEFVVFTALRSEHKLAHLSPKAVNGLKWNLLVRLILKVCRLSKAVVVR